VFFLCARRIAGGTMVASGHEADTVNAAVMLPATTSMRTRMLGAAVVASPAPRFSGKRALAAFGRRIFKR
jgi:hypothetical protein